MQIQPLTTEGIIYFPTIEFQNDGWLKRALTIWERVYRIVPSAYEPEDSDEVKQAVNAGLVETIRLTDTDREQTADKFAQFWHTKPFTPAGFESNAPRLARVHEEKIDQRVRPIFDSLSKRVETDGFVTVPKEVVNACMFWLTETVSRSRNLPKLSDDPDMFTIMQYFAHDGQVSEFVMDSEAPEYAAALVLNTLIPQGIEHASMDLVIEFQRRHAEGRAEFRTTVRNVIGELAKITDENYARQILIDLQVKLRTMHESFVASMVKSALNPQTLLLSIGLPASGSILTGLAGGDPFSAAATTVGVLFIAIAAISEAVRSRRATWSGSEASYSFDLEQQYGQSDRARPRPRNFSRLMEEFIND